MGFVGEKEGWMVWAWIGQSGNGLHRVALVGQTAVSLWQPLFLFPAVPVLLT